MLGTVHLASAWYDQVLHWLGQAGTVVAAVAATLVVAGAARSWYRRTLGRRRDGYTRLARLGTPAQLGFFTSVLGTEPAIRRAVKASNPDADPLVECFLVDRDFYVQAISDKEDTVIAFSVTTRSKNFAPTFSSRRWRQTPVARAGRFAQRVRMTLKWRSLELMKPAGRALFTVRLGHTSFADVVRPDAGPPARIIGWVSARPWSYSEAYYFGNPGFYQTYIFTASYAGGQGQHGSFVDIMASTRLDWPGDNGPGSEAAMAQLAALREFRANNRVTTYTGLTAHMSVDKFPLTTFGPHGDEVRTLP